MVLFRLIVMFWLVFSLMMVILVLRHRLKMSLSQRLIMNRFPVELVEVAFLRSVLVLLVQIVSMVLAERCMHVWILI